MDKIIEFVNDFLEAGYRTTMLRFNPKIEKPDQLLEAEKMNSFFHPVMGKSIGFDTFKRMRSDLSDEVLVELRMPERMMRRVIFQIRYYKRPKLGQALSKIFENKEDIYAAYVSFDEKTGLEVGFSSVLFIADTDEGLKIVDRYSYSHKTGTWRHSHANQPTQVLDPGTLVETLKLTPPEDEKSLEEYNADPPRKLVPEPALG